MAAAVVVLLGSNVEAAERSLGLDEALALSRRNSHDLAAARARLEQAQAGVQQARAALLPLVNGQARYTHNYRAIELALPEALGFPSPIVIQREEQLDAVGALTVPLVAPSAYGGLSSARHSAEAARGAFEVSEVAVLYQTAQSFFAAAGADELMTARHHAVEVAQRTLTDAQARRDAGTVTRVEVSRAEAALVRARQAAVDAEATRDEVYRFLGTLIGNKEPLRVAPPELPTSTPAASVPEALRARPEMLAAVQQVAAADAAASAAAWRWAPTISGFANARAFNYPGFSGDEYSWALGVQLDWQIFDGGIRDAQRRQTTAQRREAEARLGLVQDTVGDEVANAAQELATRRLALDAAKRQLDLARETLDLVRKQREAGTATQLDLLTAQDALVAADVGMAQARFDLQLGHLTLQRATGIFPEGYRR
jgi:outer membrane protein TolC